LKAKERFGFVQPWVSSAVRVAAGLVMIVAGVLKMEDLAATVRATRAYEVLPEVVVPLVGNALPFLEITVGFFLLLGLFTRWVAVVYFLMMALFVFGILSAWARGLQIDCGCFGGGGVVPEADYAGHVRDQAIFLALGAWLVALPRSALSIDGWLRTTK
jgi:uncharacterized membrane protein YphA (DoxX/SURF4 family)